MRFWISCLFLLTFSVVLVDGQARAKLSDVADHAIERSQITLPGSVAFHLKASIVETTNASSSYSAEVEEYWVSPGKWRRTITSPAFSQTIVVNEEQVFEQDAGDYYPWWLNDLVTALFDPLPFRDLLRTANIEMAQPRGSNSSVTCADLRTRIDRSIFCFEGSRGLLASVFTQQLGYDAEFKDFKEFNGKHVPRRIVIDPEPGTTIECRVTELSELRSPEEKLLSIQQPTPVSARIRSIKVSEHDLRSLLKNKPEIVWPPVGGGLTKGRCAVYVSVDRSGKTREVWPEGCDNPGLQDTLRDQVAKWEFNSPVDEKGPIQLESYVTFEFETTLLKK